MNKNEVMKLALKLLHEELNREPIRPDVICAISESIKALSGISSLSQL